MRFEWGVRSHLVRSFLRGSAVLNAQRLREERWRWGLNFLLVGPLALALLRLVWFEWGGRSHLVLSFLRDSAVLNAHCLRGERWRWILIFFARAFGPCDVVL